MRTEIGSEFWNIPVSQGKNELFPEDTQWFISGRSALKAIIAENDFHTVALPIWCCDSMISPFVGKGITVVFYDPFQLSLEISADAILIMDYFGYSQNFSIQGFSGVIIRDVTHSIFSKRFDDADYYFGSLRKWAGFLSGGFAWGFKKQVEYAGEGVSYLELRRKAMKLKSLYITDQINSKDYLQMFSEAEEILEYVGILKGWEQDIQAAQYFDIDYVKKARRRNAGLLIHALSDIAIFPDIKSDDCPLFVPVRVQDRDKLRKELNANDIYIPVHWPVTNLHQLDSKAKSLYEEELSLVCDQRYGEEDMLRMIKIINKHLGR